MGRNTKTRKKVYYYGAVLGIMLLGYWLIFGAFTGFNNVWWWVVLGAMIVFDVLLLVGNKQLGNLDNPPIHVSNENGQGRAVLFGLLMGVTIIGFLDVLYMGFKWSGFNDIWWWLSLLSISVLNIVLTALYRRMLHKKN